MLAAFPVAYVSFMSSQHVMMARNLLVVFPFLAMLAAAGAGRVAELASASRWAKGAWMVAVGLAMSANAVFLVSAGWSCRPKALPSPEGTLRNRLLESGTPGIAASPRVVAALSMLDPGAAAPVVGSDADAPLFALYSTDVRDQSRLTANEPFFLMEVFGPREVNLNYYPGWLGRSHIVVVRRSDGERLLAPRGAR